MSEILNTNKYFAAVSEMTSGVFDGNSGEKYRLRSLFFCQRFAKGNYAFLKYEDLQSRANESLSADIPADFQSLSDRLRPYTENRDAHIAMGGTKSNFDPLDRIRAALSQSDRRVQGLLPELGQGNLVDNDSNHVNKKKRVEKGRTDIKEFGLLDTINESINALRSGRTYEIDPLYHESSEKCKSLVFSDPAESRVIIFAGAGYGKSTLLQRIALAYSDCREKSDEERKADFDYIKQITEDKKLQEDGNTNIVPCVIELRKYPEYARDVEKCVRQSVRNCVGTGYEVSLDSWIISVRNKLLLLIDGLDELSSESSYAFLESLEVYLQKNPSTRVIITTRIAGVDDLVKTILRRMHFSGRTILPMDMQESRLFCEQWISTTNDSRDLIKNLDRIQNEGHLSYLREFMRKPLELVMLLHYIPKQSFSSFNRWELFYNILWAEITNHIDFDSRQSMFDDECKFMSFIAYQMQINDRLSLSFDELTKLMPEIQGLSFYSNIFGLKSDLDSICVQDVWEHLKSLAQNLGVVETVEGNKTVTFPIRSYQEYFAAYACCNLCLLEGELYPNPKGILKTHLSDTSWLGVIGFVIAGMEYSAYSEFDDFLSSLYSETENISGLSTLMETDYFNSRTAAKALCEAWFNDYSLGDDKIRLLQKCMTSKSAFSFRWALTSLYKKAFENNSVQYLEAAAFAHLLAFLSKPTDVLSGAWNMLNSSLPHENYIAAKTISLIARVTLNETPIKMEDTGMSSCNWNASIKSVRRLNELASETGSYVFVQALTELWISGMDSCNQSREFFNKENRMIAYKALSDEAVQIQRELIKTKTLSPSYVHYIKELINMLGIFPANGVSNAEEANSSLWIKSLVEAFYEIARDDVELDQIGIAMCLYHLGNSFEELMQMWAEDVCKGRPSSQVRKEHLSDRENNHFLKIRGELEASENEYFERRNSRLNILDSEAYKSPARLFLEGKDDSALEAAKQRYQAGEKDNDNNFAFLIRYLSYDTMPEFGVPRVEFIRELLSKGVSSGEAYSTMNYVLLLVEQEQFDEAKELISNMSSFDTERVAEEFWRPEIWTKRKEPEGALVCLLAELNGSHDYSRIEELKSYISVTHPSWFNLL